MKNELENITLESLAESVLPHFDSKKLVDWAINTLKLGYESENLYILAGMDNDTTEEREKYFWKSIKDLNIDCQKSKEKLIEFYANTIAKKTINKELNIENALDKMYKIIIATDYDKRYYSFFDIIEDIDNIRCYGRPLLCSGLTREKFDEYVIEEFEIFLAMQNVEIPEYELNKCYCKKCKKLANYKLKKRFQLKKPFIFYIWVCENCESKDILYPRSHSIMKLLIEKYKI